MPRYLFAGAAVLGMIASPAYADLKAPSLNASSDGSSRAEFENNNAAIATLLSFLNIEFASNAGVSTRSADKKHESHSPVSKECEQAKEEEREQLAESKRLQNSGPEPVYLAF